MYTLLRYKSLWKIAYPIMLGNLAQTLISITDTAFLGRVSSIALGAAMVAGIYYFVFSTIAWGFGTGVQIMVARRLGEGRYKRIGVIFHHGLLTVGVLAVSLFLFQHYLTGPTLKWFIQSPNIYDAAMEFMKYRHYGILFVCFNFLFRSLYIGLSNTRCISYTTLVMACVNIFLDYSLIFGHFGLPKIGIGGAAIASVCAEVSALIFFFVYTFMQLPLKKYTMFARHKVESWLLKRLLRISFPTMLQKLVSFSMWFLFFVLVEHLGEQQIAVSGIIRSVYMLIGIPTFAFGATANTLTSRLIGEGKESIVHEALSRILRLSYMLLAPILLACMLFPHEVLFVYTEDMELISSAIPSLYVICLGVAAMSFGLVYFEAVSGTGNTTTALFLEIIVQFVYVFVIWFFAVHMHAPVAYVWLSEFTYGACIGIVSFIYLKRAHWQKTL